MNRSILYAIITASAVFFSSSSSYADQPEPGKWLKNIKVDYKYNNESDSALMQIYFPKSYTKGGRFRTLIVLHGYAQNMKDWAANTNIQTFADKYKFVLVCPNMGKTLYETNYYPETANKWGKMPGGKFITDVLIQFLRSNYKLAMTKKETGILGLSTGARGALLLAAKHNNLFGAAAGLSGDYDPLSMPKDKLLTSVYGDYQKFKLRWETEDNIIKLAENLEHVPVFISHGAKDFIVPKEQSLMLALKIKQLQKNKGAGYELIFKELKHSAHNWAYWGKMVPDMLDFFDKHLNI